MVQLLTQISQQLAAGGNGSTLAVPSSGFVPPVTSVLCNVLWFVSLGLSLACALIATLLEQWARDFLHRADMRSAPVTRARIFSFLYYGLKRFKMHTIVNIIPLLLHASLFLFLAGLVAFLLPIHVGIATLVAALLAMFVGVYWTLTLLPMVHLDCPYHTPLSNACWHIVSSAATLWHSRHRSVNNPPKHRSAPTIVEATVQRAVQKTPGRDDRDGRALIWTVKSLTDDTALQPFIEGIPGVLWGPGFRRSAYALHIRRLLNTAELQLPARIEGLFRSCDSGLLTLDEIRRRRILCYEALWAMLSLTEVVESPPLPRCEETLRAWQRFTQAENLDREMSHYALSIRALLQWSTICHMKNYLAQLQADIDSGRVPILQSLEIIQNANLTLVDGMSPRLLRQFADPNLIDDTAQFVLSAQGFCHAVSYGILCDYIGSTAEKLDSLPYRWTDTIQMLTPEKSDSRAFPTYVGALEWALQRVLRRYGHQNEVNSTENLHWIDTLIHTLCVHWRPDKPRNIPPPIIRYLNWREDDEKISQLFHASSLAEIFWSSFPVTVMMGFDYDPRGTGKQPVRSGALDAIMVAIWRMVILGWGSQSTSESAVRVFQALKEKAVESSPVATSATAIMIAMTLDRHGISGLQHAALATLFDDFLKDCTLPDADSAHELITETQLSNLADYLDNFTPESLPYKAKETLEFIQGLLRIRGPISQNNQRRFAKGMRNLTKLEPYPSVFMATTVRSAIFHAYAERSTSRMLSLQVYPWLADPAARGEIVDVLAEYANRLPSEWLRMDVEEIMRNLQALHPLSPPV